MTQSLGSPVRYCIPSTTNKVIALPPTGLFRLSRFSPTTPSLQPARSLGPRSGLAVCGNPSHGGSAESTKSGDVDVMEGLCLGEIQSSYSSYSSYSFAVAAALREGSADSRGRALRGLVGNTDSLRIGEKLMVSYRSRSREQSLLLQIHQCQSPFFTFHQH